jgi:hypothetical protein
MFPDFHSSWLTYLKNALNRTLPAGYYAMAEQRASLYGPDVLAITPGPRTVATPSGGGVAVAEPQADKRLVARTLPVAGRALSVRRADGNRIVAVVEVVSPANKDRPEHVGDFVGKILSLVSNGVHAVMLDILPCGKHDPEGMHSAIWHGFDGEADLVLPPDDRPFSFAGYRADDPPVAYVSYTAVGRPLPDVPLFLDGGAHVLVPVEATYMQNFTELPPELRAVLA